MQVVIALPAISELHRLQTRICGVPLLVRAVATALRSGANKVLFLAPPCWPQRVPCPEWWPTTVDTACMETAHVGEDFDPERLDDWKTVAHALDDRFLWLPYDYVTSRTALSAFLGNARAAGPPGGRESLARPAVLAKRDLLDGWLQAFETGAIEGRAGVRVHGPADIDEAERELVLRSGKATDGIYSRFNRMLCRPAVRWLSHTPVTPNAVTFAGLAVSIAAGLCFAQGSWLWDVAGAVLFFIPGLVDEIDGMLARVTFRESAFGCWLETMVDYSSYLLIFAGMTAGGYRRGGPMYLPLGASLLLGCLLSFFVISIQRRLAAPAERPNEYAGRYLAALDRDSSNPISHAIRQLQFLTKKGVLIHYILLFALLGALPAVLVLSAVGANIAWMVTIYLNRRLFSPNRRRREERIPNGAAPVEVEK